MHVAPLGEPDAAKVARLGSVGRGWCSRETKTWPLTRLFVQALLSQNIHGEGEDKISQER